MIPVDNPFLLLPDSLIIGVFLLLRRWKLATLYFFVTRILLASYTIYDYYTYLINPYSQNGPGDDSIAWDINWSIYYFIFVILVALVAYLSKLNRVQSIITIGVCIIAILSPSIL